MDFFVIGTSRTGSTLLREMLARHPKVAILNESHWIPEMWKSFGTSSTDIQQPMSIVNLTHWDTGQRVVDVNLALAGKTWATLTDALRNRLGQRASIAAFHDAMVDEIFSCNPGSVLRGDKTPDYGFYMVLLQFLWPQARFIHVVRNGIDTARSMSKHPGCQLMISAGYDNWVPLSFDHTYRRFERRQLPFSSYVASWRRRMARIRAEAAFLKNNSYLEVRYETMLADPAGLLDQVAGFLGLESTSSWISECSALVRPRASAGQVTAEILAELIIDDLVALNDVGGIEFFLYQPDTNIGWLQSALERAGAKPREPGAGDALQVSIGVLATQTATRNAQLRARALALLRETVSARGYDVRQWALLANEAQYP